MQTEDILEWLSQAPQLEGETLNLEYLPSYAGWSLSVPKSTLKHDILGNPRPSCTVKVTRRHTVQNNTERLAILDLLEDLAAWAEANPPTGSRLRVTGLPEFTSRNSSGVEDISITFTLEEG